MPAYEPSRQITGPRERLYALAAVAVVQVVLALALLIGLRVDFARSTEAIGRLINVTLQRPPPPPIEPVQVEKRAEQHQEAAAKAEIKDPGGSPGPRPVAQLPSVTPVVAVHPTAPPSGGGTGSGPAVGSGNGGAAGGDGAGADEGGGGDLEQIAGEITPRDYPRHLGNAGIGGRVGLLFTVGVNGRVTRCSVTSSSGIPELDALTCRLIQQRFVFRPSTDRYGRPVSDDVEGEQIWEAR